MNSADPWRIILRISFSFTPSPQQQTGVTRSVLREQRAALHAQTSRRCQLARGSHILLAYRRVDAALLLVVCVQLMMLGYV